MASIKSLLLLCFCFYLFDTGEMAAREYLRKEFSLIKPFQDKGMTVPFWDFLGSTMVSNDRIRLTPDVPSKSGSIWNSLPCKARNWEIRLRFRVHGHAKNLFGDGFAFWYVRDRMRTGPVFGSMDNFFGLGVFFDTYSNHNGPHNHGHPYISATVNNGTFTYDHDRDGTHTQIAGCQKSFRNKKNDVSVNVRYTNNELTVSVDMNDRGVFEECYVVPDVVLPTGYYFGLSAATGDLSDNHDISMLKMYELDLPGLLADQDYSRLNPQAKVFSPPRDHVADPPASTLSAIKMFFLVILGMMGAGLCISATVFMIRKRHEQNLKRFY